MHSLQFARLCLFLIFFHLLPGNIIAQFPESSSPSASLFDIFFVSIDARGPSAALAAQRSSSNVPHETPIQVRLTLMFTTIEYNRLAACHPVALDSFGTKPFIPPSFCSDTRGDDQGIIIAYMTLNAYKGVFPEETRNWANYMISSGSGLDPAADTSDPNTPAGWGAAQGARISAFYANDGWNAFGDLTKTNYLLPFEDAGLPRYTPRNRPGSPLKSLRFPLRWAPLTQSVDGHGRFKTQVHVVPHIGKTVRPLVITGKDFRKRRAPPLYSTPNRRGSLSQADRKKMEKQIDKLFELSRELTPLQVQHAKFWDDKFQSLAPVSRFFERAKNFDDFQTAISRYGEALAQHDAILTVWREKVRHDLVRPTTAIGFLRSGKTVRAYDPTIGGPRAVLADEWLPIINTQPHSEYPSASAAMCTASFEFTKEYIRTKFQNATVPPFVRPFFNLDSSFRRTRVDLVVGIDDGARLCGLSRLWAGVHFEPSVPAGNEIGRGIGQAALAHVDALVSGKVPKVCYWCPERDA